MNEYSQNRVPAAKYRIRLSGKIKIIDGHWLWQGYVSKRGYGQIKVHEIDAMVFAHKLAFMVFKPTEFKWYLNVNHICHFKHCINPDHLYIGNQEDNMQDAIKAGTATQCMPKDQCQRGHLLTPDNCYYRSNGDRTCKTCAKMNSTIYDLGKKGKGKAKV